MDSSMKNFIISTKASISRIANYFRTLREHPVLSVVLAGVIFLLSSLGQTAIGKVTQMVFPQLDDASQIITASFLVLTARNSIVCATLLKWQVADRKTWRRDSHS